MTKKADTLLLPAILYELQTAFVYLSVAAPKRGMHFYLLFS
jgi:hypothetical protein